VAPERVTDTGYGSVLGKPCPNCIGPITGYNPRIGARLVKGGKRHSDLRVTLFDVKPMVNYSTVQSSSKSGMSIDP
jgi:hypothetical protein